MPDVHLIYHTSRRDRRNNLRENPLRILPHSLWFPHQGRVPHIFKKIRINSEALRQNLLVQLDFEGLD
jgi:hypothetical protein